MPNPFRRRRRPPPIRQDERAEREKVRASNHALHSMTIGSLELWELLEDTCDLLYGPGMDGEQRAMTN